MNVKSILDAKGRAVATIAPDATLAAAAHMLAEKRIGAVVVTGAGHSVAGILSERDIVRSLAEHGAGALDRSVAETMTRKVVTCSEQDSIGQLMESMTDGKFRHLPVVEGGRLVGIISIGDVVKRRLAEIESEANALKDYVMNA
ncbi:CBS domain-containing protein [Phreatobacter cathodiphilus]|uniref:Inosine-5-monophosphate dehydrogenase n=1 Tax=Phreatobacter cathodiphilus TaxID=1868589 RepID=A0A2S0NBN2_9HYPH|nr:CBS domain-containing protein [Phreatobacter cathodiphilus]AVO45353.1 inosine-5-monophosphate dehydrogenase [Phreatobacter cathodiphilus]